MGRSPTRIFGNSAELCNFLYTSGVNQPMSRSACLSVCGSAERFADLMFDAPPLNQVGQPKE